MLKLGTKVDDMFKAWTKADDAARIEGVKRLGLPKNNTAQDRAKAMGFGDETYYHGTNKSFDGFDSTRKSNVPTINGDASRNAISLSPDPDVASVYSGISPEGDRLRNIKSNTIPVKTRGKVFDYENPEHLKLLPKKYQPQASTGIWSLMEDPAIQKHLRKQGFDGYQSNELQQPFFVTEPYKGQHRFNPLKQKDIDLYNRERKFEMDMHELSDPVKNTQLFDGANIRSPLAHFNPKMAGIGGAGAILSNNLMADELDLEHKPKVSAWDSLMNTIGGVNQQQAQAYGDTGAGTMEGTANIAHLLATDPAVAGEVIGGGALSLAGATAPWVKGFGAGLLLDAGEVSAAERPGFFEELQKKRIR